MSTVTVYKDKDGKEYTYHNTFSNPEDDLVILSKDDIAFRVDSLMLRAASPVIRHMMATCNPNEDSDHVPLDHSSEAISIFLSAVMARSLLLEPEQLDELKEALQCGDQLEIGTTAKRMLDYLPPVKSFDAGQLFPLLALAGRYGHLELAYHVLSQGWRVTNSTHLTLDPTTDWPSSWTVAAANQLPSDWVWALTMACKDTNKSSNYTIDETQRKPYWVQVVGKFLNNLHSA